jgi:hypothetical protein
MVQIQMNILKYMTVIISQNTFSLVVEVAVAVAVAVTLKRKFLLNQTRGHKRTLKAKPK